MFPVRFRQNLSEEPGGGFIDDNANGNPPPFTRDDSQSGDPDESDCDRSNDGPDVEG
jgi:hypothetical protein